MWQNLTPSDAAIYINTDDSLLLAQDHRSKSITANCSQTKLTLLGSIASVDMSSIQHKH